MQALPKNHYLQGNFAPWPYEGEINDCHIIGNVPKELNGVLYRNGPNPQYPGENYHWFFGDGMVHAFFFENGTVRYRNRWVRTERFQREREARRSLFGGFDSPDQLNNDSPGNTNVVYHGGRLLALTESNLPWELDPISLETMGECHFNQRLSGSMTAHPKIDHKTLDLFAFGYSPEPLVNYFIIDKNGALTQFDQIEVPFASMMHDFAISKNHIILPIFPATIDLARAQNGGPLIAWEPDRGTHIGIMLRAGTPNVEWFEMDACFAYHVVNAYEQKDTIILDVIKYTRVPFLPKLDSNIPADYTPGNLVRWEFNLKTHQFLEEKLLSHYDVEFPRIDDRLTGINYQYIYMPATLNGDNNFTLANAILAHDIVQNKTVTCSFARGDVPSEVIFIPRSKNALENDGFLLTVIYRGHENRSDLLILDASDIAKPALATIQLPHRIPFGFHGNWWQS